MAITSAVKLELYNGALRRIGSRRLASLTESREPRRVLDDIWGADNQIVRWALERGEWNFAIRSVQADYDPGIEPDFGFRRAYEKPEDFVRLASLTRDAYFRSPLTNAEYMDEATYWFTDLDVIYVRYVSDDTDYGFSSAAWSESFKNLIEVSLAYEGVERITNSSGKLDRILRDYDRALKEARSHDAMSEGVKFPPRGSWLRARGASRYGDE